MSINMFFLSCIFLYVFFLTYFIFVHNLFSLAFKEGNSVEQKFAS